MFDEFANIIIEDLPSKLSPIRRISHHIDLIPRSSLPKKATYKMTPQENEEVKRQLQELLDKLLSMENLSSCDVPTMLNPKKDGGWKICIDSKAINKITIIYKSPLPHLDVLINYLSDAKYFSKIDLKSGHH